MNEVKSIVERGVVRLFCCGGAGINIGSTFENYRVHKEPGMATIDCVYLDTSLSNLKPNLPDDKVFVIPGLDGAGKERRHAGPAAMKHVKEMLQKHRPGYVNVILSSASGGSGAVLAAVVAKELLDKDELVIMIAVGVSDSGTEIKNTLDTLKSFEGLVATTKHSVVAAYFENSKDTPPSVVDSKIHEMVTAIATLFSRQNEGLDSRDLYNFLNFDRMTPYKAHAAGLEAYARALDPAEHKNTITVASAVTNKDNRGIDFVIPYTCYGILPADTPAEIAEQAPMHLVTKAFAFNEIAKRLRGHLSDMEEAAAANTAKSEVLADDDELEGGFLAM